LAEEQERKRETMTVHSLDRESWLTKLERIKLLASQKQDIRFNNIGHIISLEMLESKYQELSANKAVGMDGITKEDYGQQLKANLQGLLTKIRKGQYHPKPARVSMIPKEDGGSRPLVISCFEDKIVESTVSTILSGIYEPIFLECSFGFRPNKSAHGALRELNRVTYCYNKGAIVEIDITKCFNTIPHKALINILKEKISDSKFIKLIEKLLARRIMEGETIVTSKEGCQQGSIISPILANIFLHYVVDDWFKKTSDKYFVGKASMVRYCDDMVFVFENELDATKFYEVLPKRLSKYGISMNEAKSQKLVSGKYHAEKLHKQGKKIESYNFLGFTCYWGRSRYGTTWRLKYTSRRDRFTEKLKNLRKYLKENMNSSNRAEILQKVTTVIRGWINYHGISDNQRRVRSFIEHGKRILLCWFRRMGGKRRISWNKFILILKGINYPERWKTTTMIITNMV
jgi:group II intron reverse transcriptase/maturase